MKKVVIFGIVSLFIIVSIGLAAALPGEEIFGYNGSASGGDTIQNVTRGSAFTTTEAGTATKISANLWTVGGNAKAAIYKHSDSTLVAVSEEEVISAGWINFPISASLTANTEYVLVVSSSSFTSLGKIDGDENQGHINGTIAYDDAFPSTVSFTHSNDKYCIYCTYTTAVITSCNSTGYEINEFAPGENVSVKAEGLEASTTYKIWIQDNPVEEGDPLVVGENPSSAETPKEVTTDGDGNFGLILIWSIPSNAPVTHHEYDIVVNKGTDEVGETYNVADDGLDSASVAGITAPVPDVSALLLFASGLILVMAYLVHGRRKKGELN